ncbi:unnamed protein product [Phytomonas sp. Hart1]|nr:unnamed protein product [Phytomonas sp. Hart1]|eukprot:CCW68162.1 unnamed protein product [Phytomonas sp. isolate Hart1]
MKSRGIDKVWRAAPLPQTFQTALESGDWVRALHIYQRHPYHAPPSDTYDLLKSIMHATGIGVEDVKSRFNEKITLSAIFQRKTPEEVEWGAYWEALNNGDGKIISAALSGASVSAPAQQIAIAEACAVLLKAAGKDWEKKLVDSTPFATVTRSNLAQVSLMRQRSDVAVDILRHTRFTRADVSVIWPLMSQFGWKEVLQMISACPKNSVPYDQVLPFILKSGCSLQTLSEHLEQARVLSDVDVVAPLIAYAIETQNWDYIDRGMEHLVDIGQVAAAARDAFTHLCKLHGHAKVCKALQDHNLELSKLTIKRLELLRL